MTSQNNRLPIVERVKHSLSKLGYSEIDVSSLGEGNIKLSGRVETTGDRAIAIAAARSVSGVTGVDSEVRP